MKSALVTGTSTGIGRATALDLDREGWRVFAGYRKDADAESIAAEASERLVPLEIDVTDEGQIAAAAERIGEAVGADGLDGLVNNAGTPFGGPLEFVTIDDLRRQLDVNVVGQVAVTQKVLPQLRAAKGRIVNITSMGGRVAAPFFGPYSASKFAMEAITDTLRRELHDFGIWVAAVEPGSIATEIWDRGQERGDELVDRAGEKMEKHYPGKIEAFRAVVRETADAGIDPQKAADAIRRALTDSRPKPRYVVGSDARQAITAQRILPTRAFDAIVRKQTGL